MNEIEKLNAEIVALKESLAHEKAMGEINRRMAQAIAAIAGIDSGDYRDGSTWQVLWNLTRDQVLI